MTRVLQRGMLALAAGLMLGCSHPAPIQAGGVPVAGYAVQQFGGHGDYRCTRLCAVTHDRYAPAYHQCLRGCFARRPTI